MTAFGLPLVPLVYISEQQCPGRLGARFIKGSPRAQLEVRTVGIEIF